MLNQDSAKAASNWCLLPRAAGISKAALKELTHAGLSPAYPEGTRVHMVLCTHHTTLFRPRPTSPEILARFSLSPLPSARLRCMFCVLFHLCTPTRISMIGILLCWPHSSPPSVFLQYSRGAAGAMPLQEKYRLLSKLVCFRCQALRP